MPLELAIAGLSKTYPNGVQALRDVTLTIPTGMYGLLGPNGAGIDPLNKLIDRRPKDNTAPVQFR